MSKLISEEEVQLYDRQIRLWGVEAQNRLKNARVLILGVNGLSCEIIKNLVLIGIEKIALCDELNVTEEDVNNNFLISRSSIGENRALSAKSRTETLNPRVKVEAYNYLPIEICDAMEDNKLTLEEFDIIACCTSSTSSYKLDDFWSNINEKCRKYNKTFFGMESFGWHGLTFMDLGHHNYVKEELSIQKPGEKPMGNASKWIPETKQFCTLDEVLSIDWSEPRQMKKLKRIPKMQFVMLAMQAFVAGNRRYSNASDKDDIFDIWCRFAKKCGLSADLLNNDDFQECVGAGNVPVNAVLGGLVTQEIIKAISKKNEPVGNFVLFNGVICCADSTFIKNE